MPSATYLAIIANSLIENFTIKAGILFAFLATNLAKGPKLLERVIKKLAKIANFFLVIFMKMVGTNAKYFVNISKGVL